jgi:hypothetical protein
MAAHKLELPETAEWDLESPHWEGTERWQLQPIFCVECDSHECESTDHVSLGIPAVCMVGPKDAPHIYAVCEPCARALMEGDASLIYS